MDSSRWIDHFYRNACQSKRVAIPPSFGLEDQKCFRAVRPGQMSLRSGRRLIEKSRDIALRSKDQSFAWAVRLYVREQERRNGFLTGLVSGDSFVERDDWRGTVIDAMPADLVMLLLGCRARVAARFFGALARRSECPHMRLLYEALEQEELGQLRFTGFAAPLMSGSKRPMPRVLVKCAARAVTFGIATRVWIRQRTRLRDSGQTFSIFVSALLEAAG